MDHISKEGLKERGWTASLIERFLPVPDKREAHPKNARWHKMCLYKLTRVRSIEMSEEFLEAYKKRRRRK
jgi:hypothetical protein